MTASAPARIDLAGGTLDIWPLNVILPGAVTVNVAIDLRARATVEPRAGRVVRVVSEDRGLSAERGLPLGEDDYRGGLGYLLRLVGAFRPPRGLTLTCRAAAPAGAGLGGSSTLGVAVGAALDRFTGTSLGRDALLTRVMNVEAAELGVPTGNQDYLAAIHGGLSVWRHGPDGTRRERIAPPPELEGRLVLAYTGRPRQSGYSNWDMYRRFVDRERATVARMRRICRIAGDLALALRRGRLDEAGRLLGEEGRLRYRLAPSVETSELRRASVVALRAGALGVKVCGAGGGGCLVAFAARGRTRSVEEAIASTGARILPVKIARGGVRVSSVPRKRGC